VRGCEGAREEGCARAGARGRAVTHLDDGDQRVQDAVVVLHRGLRRQPRAHQVQRVRQRARQHTWKRAGGRSGGHGVGSGVWECRCRVQGFQGL